MFTCLVSLAFASSPAIEGGPPHGPPPGPPPIGAMVMHRVDALDLPEGTRSAVAALADAARTELDADHAAVEQAHEALAAALTVDAPDRGEVLAAARTLEAAEARLRERELLLVVAIAQAVGPDTWAEVADELPAGPPSGPDGRGDRTPPPACGADPGGR